MLPIYEAIDVIDIINEKVGHTKPWVVLANTPDGLASFVVKMYNDNQVDHLHCVTKEIICNVLAKEFDFCVPDCAFINIPNDLTFKLPADAQQQFDNADYRLKFATIQLKNVNNALNTLSKNEFSKRIDLDTLYAFDNLVRNCDRGNPKANLLLSSTDAFLIDHELTLGRNDITNQNFDNLILDDRFSRYHLFYAYLKNAQFKTRESYFDDFSNYLHMLNTRTLNPYFQQLRNEGFSDYSLPILSWLEQCKEKNTIFVNLLKGSLR